MKLDEKQEDKNKPLEARQWYNTPSNPRFGRQKQLELSEFKMPPCATEDQCGK